MSTLCNKCAPALLLSNRLAVTASTIRTTLPSHCQQFRRMSRPAQRLASLAQQTAPPPSSSSSSSSPALPRATMSSNTGTASGRLTSPLLLVCDIQEKFQTAIFEFAAVVATTQKLLRASDILGFPVAASTQNRDKLGDTVGSLDLGSRKHLLDVRDKTRFSMYSAEASFQALLRDEQGRRRDVLLVGIETHICVTQTALDLMREGHRVYVVSDGVSSCNREEKPVALARLAREGAVVTTSESVIYEIMGDANIVQFREIAKLVKESKSDTTEALAKLHW